MTASNPDVERNRRDARLIAFIIAGTMLAWMGAQWLGGKMGWETDYAAKQEIFQAKDRKNQRLRKPAAQPCWARSVSK